MAKKSSKSKKVVPIEHRSLGWRPSAPDIRDNAYKFIPKKEVVAALPDRYSTSLKKLGSPYNPVWQQEDVGSCGPHSAGGDLVFSQFTQENHKKVLMPSRLFIYYNARAIMGTVESDSGVDNRSMMKALVQFGWCDEELWPYVTSKFTAKPPKACYEQGATRKISGYGRVDQDLQTMMACLAGGDPFIFGFNVYSSLMTAAVDKTGIIPLPKFTDRRRGGHDILLTGYNNSDQEWNGIPAKHFELRNSWGEGWGNKGYGYIPFRYAIDPQLADDFWTIRKTGLVEDEVTPPVPAPTPDPLPVPPVPGADRIPALTVIYDQFGSELSRMKPVAK